MRDDGETVSRIDATVECYLDLYPKALPEVYGYVARRVTSTPAAEDVTAETFVSALATIKRGTVADPTVAWLIAIARNKVVDHWRRIEREERRRRKAADEPTHNPSADHNIADPGDVVLDIRLAHDTLARLSTVNRAALSLRYLDALTVGEVANHLGRTPGAVEALLTRAKAAFRAAYPDDNLEGGER